MRIGHGYDVHRIVAGDGVVICGCKILCEFSLLGHSDADVALHALSDALLGSLALGDIGHMFPDTDPQYKGISSIILLKRVYEEIKKNGYRIENADITIIAQNPKMAPYISDMRKNIAQAIETDTDRISVKATTEEQLGFTGRGEGIAAHAVVLVEKV